jgi:hypothetical protein
VYNQVEVLVLYLSFSCHATSLITDILGWDELLWYFQDVVA